MDIHRPSLEAARAKGIFDDHIVGDIRHIGSLFKGKSFDAVVAFDLIEHLTKDEGYRLVQDMERLAKKVILIFTPNGFFEQEEYDQNPWQKHQSGWAFREMERLGFQVYGINGWKQLRGRLALPRLKPYWIGFFFSNLSWLLLRLARLEQFSFHILCIKNLAPSSGRTDAAPLGIK